MHAYIHTYIHSHTYSHAYIYIYIRVYIGFSSSKRRAVIAKYRASVWQFHFVLFAVAPLRRP